MTWQPIVVGPFTDKTEADTWANEARKVRHAAYRSTILSDVGKSLIALGGEEPVAVTRKPQILTKERRK